MFRGRTGPRAVLGACVRGAMLALIATVAACFQPLDLTGRRCPCDLGWRCVDEQCVQGDLDAGLDGNTIEDAPRVPPDAGPFVCPTGAFCDDFEAPFPGDNGWSTLPDLARVSFLHESDRDPRVPAYRGSGYVRIRTSNLAGQSQLEICPFEGFACPTSIPPGEEPGIVSGDVHLRAYLYFPSTLASGDAFEIGHASVLHVGTHQGPFAEEEAVSGFNVDVGRTAMYVGSDETVGRVEPRPDVGTEDTRPAFPRDEWTCVRVALHVSDTAGSIAVFVGPDDVAEVERVNIDTLAARPYLHFGVGLGYTDGMVNGAEMFVDDVAFARTPLPCWR